MSWNTPEFQVSMLDAYMGAMQDGRAPQVIDQIRGEIEDIQRQAAAEQDRHESLAMQWSGVGFRASQILQNEIARFREAAVRHVPTTWDELLPRIDNVHQRDTLQRLTYRSEARQIFLSAFTAGDERGDVEGTFTVLGTRNRQGQRETYQVKWFKQSSAQTASRGSFWCNCPDHKFNSTKKHIVCKHICFLICRVARFMDPVFFETHRLTPEQQGLFQRIVRENTIFSSPTTERPAFLIPPTDNSAAVEQRRATFFECRKPITAEDSCPICCDGMEANACVSCPTCSNNIHRECMEVWLERKSTCVYCRSHVWSQW
jgi:hypothetical protein